MGHWRVGQKMTMTINFTKAALQEIKHGDRRLEIADRKTPNLRLVVYPSGEKTYFLRRRVKGTNQRIKIGRYSDISIDQARNQATQLNSFIGLGGDPLQEKKIARAELTFKELFSKYYSDHLVPHTKRPDDNKRMMEFHILRPIGNDRLSEISPERIRKLHITMGSDRGQGTANRVITLVNATFNFGIRNGYYKLTNPCYGLKKFKQCSRDRFLSSDELKLFFKALESEKTLFREFFLLLLYTGARKSNVLSMRWTDIDFDLGRWRIRESETKNGDVNIVYLTEISLDILRKRKAINDMSVSPSEYVFPGDSHEINLKDPKKAFQRIRDRMKVQDIRMHDLRRTLASYMAISGASLPIIGKALNHKSQVSTAIYARLAQAPVMEALNTASELMNRVY